MKSFFYTILTALILAASLAGCGSTKQESAMQWMDRVQPVAIDP